MDVRIDGCQNKFNKENVISIDRMTANLDILKVLYRYHVSLVIGWSDSRFAAVIFVRKSPFPTISVKNQKHLQRVCGKLEN